MPDLRGISGGTDGRFVSIDTTSLGSGLRVFHNDASVGVSADRILTPGMAPYVDVPNHCVVYFEHRGSRWHMVGGWLPSSVDVEARLSLVADVSPAALVANQNNWNPTGLSEATVLRVDPGSGDRLISGLVGGTDGRVLIVEHVGSTSNLISLLHDATGMSNDYNCFLLPGAVDYVLEARQSVVLLYDATASRWRPVGGLPPLPASAVTPEQTFGLAGSVGSGRTYALGNHTHGTPVNPVPAHEGAGDPHAQYRLEADNHTHASSGVQGGQVAHSALSGVAATDHHAAPAAGPDANVTVDAAGAAGTASTFARSGHGHQVQTYASAAADVTSSGSSGTSGTAPSRGNHAHAHAVIASGDLHPEYATDTDLTTHAATPHGGVPDAYRVFLYGNFT